MRVVRIVCFLALLVAVVAIQSSLAQSSTGTDPSAQDQQQPPANSNQQPVSPLQEPPKPTDADVARQQQQQQSSFSVGEASGSGQDQELGEVRLMSRYTEVNGDKTRSFRDPGMNNLAEFNYFMDRRFLVTHRIQTLSMFRATDDYSIDPEKNSIQKAYVRIYSPKDEIVIGDALVNYSRLTFNQNIKGVSATKLFASKWKFSTTGGVFIDRYGSLYKDLPNRPYVAAVGGARLQYQVRRDTYLGFNYSESRDIIDTLPFTAPGTSPQPANNRVGSIDLKWQQKGLRVDSEFAYSGTDFDKRDSTRICPSATDPLSGCDSRTPVIGLGMQWDWGGRLEASYRYHKFNLRTSYVRYQPTFASINARQISDLQDVIVRTGYDVTDWLTVDGTMRRSNNDLKQQLPFETRLWGPEARFVFHELPFYRKAVFEVGYRHRIIDASDGSISRFVRIPYAEFTLPISTTFLTLGYERRQAVDQLSQDQTSNTNRVYAGLRGIYDLGGWHINPSFRFELERQAQRPDLLNTAALDPLRFDLDSNRLDTAMLLVEPPKWFIFEMAFRDSTATIFGPTGYSRPSYRAQVTYKIMNDENILLVFSFERNNNFYFASPNYDERISGVSFVYKFGKRGQ